MPKGVYLRDSSKRPRTVKSCPVCASSFPVRRLAQQYCSPRCKAGAQRTGRRVLRRTLPHARGAQSLVAYHVRAGNLVRPARCEQCDRPGRIEAAHYDYKDKLRVRWLCRSCHVRWDRAEPKGATVIVERWQNLTGGKAERGAS